MRSITQLVVKMLDRMQIRFQRARPGSILILVVVLVVLLALIGTATLSTTQGDRYIAVQNSANTQIDLIVQGAIEMAKAAIYGDLFGGTNGTVTYRPAENINTGTTIASTDYDHFDAYDLTGQYDPGITTPPSIQNDKWLSPRVPTVYAASGTSPVPAWSNLGIMPGFTTFESPLAIELHAGTGNFGMTAPDLALPRVYGERVSRNLGTRPEILEPNYVFPYGFTDGRSFPAFNLPQPTFGSRFVLAGDADGDGIADSGLFRFPIGEIDGVTYYGAIRIIDNNSAININTAWSASTDFNFTTGPSSAVDALGTTLPGAVENNLGIFPSHVGLLEMMHLPQAYDPSVNGVPLGGTATTEMNAINSYRNASQTPTANAIDDINGPRSDFTWNTQGEAYAFQLARRLQNPGSISTGNRYKAFESGESTTLAYRFGLQNRDISASPLERLTSAAVPRDSIYESAGNDDSNTSSTEAVFGPNRQTYISDRYGIAAWFDDNFHFEGYSSAFQLSYFGNPSVQGVLPHNGNNNYKRSLRPFLTTSNPVSNAIRPRFWNNSGSVTLPSTLAMSTLSLARHLIHPLDTSGLNNQYQYSYMAPYAVDPVKTNPNTATFDELWRAYWTVMMEYDPNDANRMTPFADVANQNKPYFGMEFDSAGANGQFLPTGGPSPQRMFRSPLRPPDDVNAVTVNYMAPKEVLLLRSAIAAVQTMQMRGPAPNHASNPLVQDQPTLYERIEFPEGTMRDLFPNKQVRFTVFGNTPQPFITEVFVWRDVKTKDPIGGSAVNMVPYVSVELYNPYSVPVTLTSKMKLAMVKRNSGQIYNGSALNVTDVHTFSNEVIQPGQFLLLDNANLLQFLPSGIDRPQNPQPLQVDLTGVVTGGNELILLEELQDDLPPFGVLRKPLDSFDFHSFKGSDANTMTWWHYARPCGDDNRWQCVYPGRYQVHNSAGREERHQGTDWKEWQPDDNTGAVRNTDPGFDVPYQPTLGRASGTNFGGAHDPTYRPTIPAALPIPLNDLDFGGPNKKIDLTGNKFPYGGFMRDGDILQVPYIGAYTITVHTGASDPGILVDMNSISMDAAFAEDSDPQDDYQGYPDNGGPREHVGRFAPIRMTSTIDDFDPTNTNHRYAWANDLFDYFSVNTPSLDFLPQYPMQREWLDLHGQSKRFFKGALYSVYDLATGAHRIYRCDATGDYTVSSMDPAASGAFTQLVQAMSVKNGKANASTFGAGPAAETENNVGVQGLININTAPWKVLSAVPWVTRGSDRFNFDDYSKNFSVGQNGKDDNEDIARAITYWRDGNAIYTSDAYANGPFRSLFDLYRVRVPVTPGGTYVFDLVQNTLAPPTPGSTEPDDSLGDFSPYNQNPLAAADPKDHSRNDFEEQFWLLTKVSNLLTTRSDSFTVYIQVQGWRGIGTLKPELVVQRRVAFIQDRSAITKSSSRIPPAVTVPND